MLCPTNEYLVKLDLSTFLQKRIMNPKNIRVRIALSVNGAVIHVVCPAVDRATVERGKNILRQHVVRPENSVKMVDWDGVRENDLIRRLLPQTKKLSADLDLP